MRNNVVDRSQNGVVVVDQGLVVQDLDEMLHCYHGELVLFGDVWLLDVVPFQQILQVVVHAHSVDAIFVVDWPVDIENYWDFLIWKICLILAQKALVGDSSSYDVSVGVLECTFASIVVEIIHFLNLGFHCEDLPILTWETTIKIVTFRGFEHLRLNSKHLRQILQHLVVFIAIFLFVIQKDLVDQIGVYSSKRTYKL